MCLLDMHQNQVLSPYSIVVGLVTDIWQRGLIDLGVFSLDGFQGGTYVLYGPKTPRDKIPDIKGATMLPSKTNNSFILMRFIQIEGETPVAELQSKVKIYAASEKPGIDLVPGGDKPLQGYPPRTM